MTDKTRSIIDDESYEVWFNELKNNLNDFLTASEATACYEISALNKIHNFLLIDDEKEDVVKNIKKSSPNCISYCAVVNYLNCFDDTEIFDIFSSSGLSKVEINKVLDGRIKVFEFLKGKEIGYEVYLHYPSVTYKLETGYIPIFKKKQGVEENNDELFDYNDELDETEEERLEREVYEKESEEKLAKIENFAKELSGDKRLALTKNKDQRNALAKMFFKERLGSSWNEWDIDRIVVRAINIYELEVLPKLVSDLVKQSKTPKQISDELGISLSKAKKVLAVVAE
ncbi:MAG: hypothetical protein RR677_06050 [Acinetobacter sp.]